MLAEFGIRPWEMGELRVGEIRQLRAYNEAKLRGS